MDGNQSPTVIYLPSSGGRAGSRISLELVTRRKFPFRRYSVEEDGSLSVRVKNANRDARSHPYMKPAVRFTTPPSHHSSPSPRCDSTTSTHGRNSTAELLKNLIPALVEDPAGFEASISSICAAHDIDRSVISAVTQAAKRKSSLNPLERTRTLDRSNPSVPTISSTPTVSLIPFKHERPFPPGHRGATTWFTTQSNSDVTEPPRGLPEVAGHLFVHRNISTSTSQVWLFDRDAQWNVVDVAPDGVKTTHPTLPDRVLSFRLDGTPNWITMAAFRIRGRRP